MSEIKVPAWLGEDPIPGIWLHMEERARELTEVSYKIINSIYEVSTHMT